MGKPGLATNHTVDAQHKPVQINEIMKSLPCANLGHPRTEAPQTPRSSTLRVEFELSCFEVCQ